MNRVEIINPPIFKISNNLANRIKYLRISFYLKNNKTQFKMLIIKKFNKNNKINKFKCKTIHYPYNSSNKFNNLKIFKTVV